MKECLNTIHLSHYLVQVGETLAELLSLERHGSAVVEQDRIEVEWRLRGRRAVCSVLITTARIVSLVELGLARLVGLSIIGELVTGSRCIG